MCHKSMKKYIVLALLVSGCSQNEDNGFDQELYGGTWHLSEVLADPGDGSGIYRPVDSDMYLTFDRNGIFMGNEPLCQNSGTSGTYDDEKLYPEDCNFPLTYEKDGNTLFVYPPCIEPCGLKFVRD